MMIDGSRDWQAVMVPTWGGGAGSSGFDFT